MAESQPLTKPEHPHQGNPGRLAGAREKPRLEVQDVGSRVSRSGPQTPSLSSPAFFSSQTPHHPRSIQIFSSHHKAGAMLWYILGSLSQFMWRIWNWTTKEKKCTWATFWRQRQKLTCKISLAPALWLYFYFNWREVHNLLDCCGGFGFLISPRAMPSGDGPLPWPCPVRLLSASLTSSASSLDPVWPLTPDALHFSPRLQRIRTFTPLCLAKRYSHCPARTFPPHCLCLRKGPCRPAESLDPKSPLLQVAVSPAPASPLSLQICHVIKFSSNYSIFVCSNSSLLGLWQHLQKGNEFFYFSVCSLRLSFLKSEDWIILSIYSAV